MTPEVSCGICLAATSGFAALFLRRDIKQIYHMVFARQEPTMTPLVDWRRSSSIADDWHKALISGRHADNIAAGYPPYHEINSRILRLEDRERERTQEVKK